MKIINFIKLHKSKIFAMTLLIVLILFLSFGLTRAYFDFMINEEGESSLRTQATNLNVRLSMSSIDLSDMMPIFDNYKDTQANIFNFTMSNTSRRLSGCADLYLNVTSISEALKNTDFKWELVNLTNSTTTTGNFTDIESGRILLRANETIAASATYSYRLKIWYSFRSDIDQSSILGSHMTSTLTSIAYAGACASTNSVVKSTQGTSLFEASDSGYYRVETYNGNGSYSSGEIFLAEDEALSITIPSSSSGLVTVSCYIDKDTGLCGSSSSGYDADNSRIMYVNSSLTNSFISGYAGSNSPNSATTNAAASNNTNHPSGKFFLNGDMKFNTGDTTIKAVITYLGNYSQRINTKLNGVRYVKDCINGSVQSATTNQWLEIQAIKNGVNLAKDKTVTGTSSASDSYAKVVDGIITGDPSASSNSGLQCVTVDLGATYDLDEIAIWHVIGRTFNANVTSVSANNSSWTTIINTTEAETSVGKRASAYRVD